MKQYFLLLIIFVICYFSFVGIFFTMNKKVAFNDIDFDHNSLLTISELTLDYGIVYKCYQKDKIVQTDSNLTLIQQNQCDLIVEEVFSKKDGVTIKERIYRDNV